MAAITGVATAIAAISVFVSYAPIGAIPVSDPGPITNRLAVFAGDVDRLCRKVIQHIDFVVTGPDMPAAAVGIEFNINDFLMFALKPPDHIVCGGGF
ncbi:MAG: hypothetical protein ABJL55_01365 [Roseibium sp.]